MQPYGHRICYTNKETFTMKALRITYIFAISALLLVSVSSCEKDTLGDCVEHAVTPCNEDPAMVNIKIHNASEYDFCNVFMNPNSVDANYGIILSGESTCYKSFDVAYSYGYVKLYIENQEFILQPFDYVGEVPLVDGNYTYTIDVVDFDNRTLSHELN